VRPALSCDSFDRKELHQRINAADYAHRVGNLTVLKPKVNRDAADESFQNKQKIALNDSTLAINHHFQGLSQRTDVQIEKRQEDRRGSRRRFGSSEKVDPQLNCWHAFAHEAA
jgi:hypothetical protein